MKEAAVKVLLIEDEKDMRELLELELQHEGFEVGALGDGEQLIESLENFSPDVLLLDQRLPGKTGNEIVSEIRSHAQFYDLPIIMVTGLIEEGDKVNAFKLGADDYVTKPFMVKEVSARIRALVRRSTGGLKSERQHIVDGDLEVNYSTYKATLNGEEISLTLTEFRILGELLRSGGNVLSRDGLRERALGNLSVTDRTIDVHMASLRKKIQHRGKDIETVRGIGYRFVSPNENSGTH